MMLRHIGEFEAAEKIENALSVVFERGEKLTIDLGGTTGTKEFAEEICKFI
jgi:isocitrate dehydrogenase (NAD+)